jgi:endonuclease YncB( thermonuclease family)
VRVRLAGIDAPERRSRCAAERDLAGEALVHMRYLLRQPQITLRNIRRVPIQDVRGNAGAAKSVYVGQCSVSV